MISLEAASPVTNWSSKVKRILIIEDNFTLAHGLKTNLELEGFEVDVAPDAPRGVERAGISPPDLVILDVMLPGADGFQALEVLRTGGFDAPVLILSARAEETDKVHGFRSGADDYVTKPFGLLELIARVQALLRRAGRPSGNGEGPVPESFTIGEIEIYPLSRIVRRAGNDLSLRPKEYDLLLALARRRGRVVPRNELLRDVWGYQAGVYSRTLDTHIADLRRKLERNPSAPDMIVTVHKVGYRLQA